VGLPRNDYDRDEVLFAWHDSDGGKIRLPASAGMIRIPGIGGHAPDSGQDLITCIVEHDPNGGKIRIPEIGEHDPEGGQIGLPEMGEHDPYGGKIRLPEIGGHDPDGGTQSFPGTCEHDLLTWILRAFQVFNYLGLCSMIWES
jgi:hypothetical protein